MPGIRYGERVYPKEQKYNFTQVQQCVITADSTSADNGSVTVRLFANRPTYHGGSTAGTTNFVRPVNSAANDRAACFNLEGDQPFGVPSIDAQEAFEQYEYGVVLGSKISVHLRPMAQTNANRQEGLESGSKYCTDTVCYLTTTRANFIHGTTSAEIQSNNANGTLRRMAKATTDIGITRQEIGSAALGCTLSGSYTPRKFFAQQGGLDIYDNLGDGTSADWGPGATETGGYSFKVVQDPGGDKSKNWLQPVTGPAGNLGVFYTLTLTPKLPMVVAGTVPAASTFVLGKPVPHHCVFQITTTVLMYRLTADTVSLDSLRLGPPRGGTGGPAAMDEELDNREEDMHHGSHNKAHERKKARMGGRPMSFSQMATTGGLAAGMIGAARAYNSGGVEGFLHDAHAGEL